MTGKNPRGSRIRWLVRLLVASLPVLLFSLPALARFGGGEHFGGGSFGGGFHGGGFHSGGSGSGGGGLFYVVYYALQLTIDYPKFMLPLWGVVIVGYIYFHRNVVSRDDDEPVRPIRRLETARVSFDKPDDQLGKLKGRDPAFDEDAFLNRTRRVFHELQEAWFFRHLEKARQYMSDGLFRRYDTLETIMRLEGRRDALADDKVTRARIVGVEETAAFDIITVRIDATIRDTDVPADRTDDQARAAAARQGAEPFTEMWTFVRRLGAKSRPGFDVSEGHCPNCGADFKGGESNTCEYCKAIVNSGNYDWVLADITQLDEYVRSGRTAPGIEALLGRDPDAAPEILEDRAQLLFWKWLHAFAASDPKILQKVARSGFVDGVRSQLAALTAQGTHAVVKVPAVGGADVVAVEVDDDGWDRVHVDIRWSGIVALEPGDALGRLTQRPRRHVLQMIRRTGATTDRGAGLATERCGNCQAPLTNSDSTICEYCGHDLAGGEKDWLVEALVPYLSWSRPLSSDDGGPVIRLGGASRGHVFGTMSERTRLLQVLTALAKADGLVDSGERRILRKCAQRWGVPWDRVEVMLSSGSSFGLEGLDRIPPEQAAELMSELTEMVGSHGGRVHPRERALLRECARRLNVPADKMPGILDG